MDTPTAPAPRYRVEYRAPHLGTGWRDWSNTTTRKASAMAAMRSAADAQPWLEFRAVSGRVADETLDVHGVRAATETVSTD